MWRPSAIERAVRYIIRHQAGPTKGFATYAPSDRIERFIGAFGPEVTVGWHSAHVCVTAVALQSLLELGASTDEGAAAERALNYLQACRSCRGLWESYWWPGEAYATYHALKALAAADRLRTLDLRSTVNSLCDNQLGNGAWSGGASTEPHAFSTALNVLALLLCEHRDALQAAARGIDWLIRNQCQSGSWQIAPILRIPPPMVEDPCTVDDWRLNEIGTGVIIEDRNGIFTTATSLRALTVFRAMSV